MSDQTDAQKTCELANRLPAPMAVDILTDALLMGDRKAQARIAQQTEQIDKLATFLADKQLGTPCEAIRHAQEVCALQARIAELTDVVKYIADQEAMYEPCGWAVMRCRAALEEKP